MKKIYLSNCCNEISNPNLNTKKMVCMKCCCDCTTHVAPDPNLTFMEQKTVLFHNLYEKFAQDFGYQTREDTKEFDFETPNGKLMLKVVSNVLLETINEIQFKLNKQWDLMESNDSDNSTENWRAYKRIRNTNNDIINLIKNK